MYSLSFGLWGGRGRSEHILALDLRILTCEGRFTTLFLILEVRVWSITPLPQEHCASRVVSSGGLLARVYVDRCMELG